MRREFKTEQEMATALNRTVSAVKVVSTRACKAANCHSALKCIQALTADVLREVAPLEPSNPRRDSRPRSTSDGRASPTCCKLTAHTRHMERQNRG
jgi:hypothetical protein